MQQVSRVADVAGPPGGAGSGSPAPADLVVLGAASVAVSTSGPMIAALSAPALAIAFWRNAFGAGVTALAVFTRASVRRELRDLTGRQMRVTALAGLLLAAHFACWTPSLGYTNVASATALVCSQPVWTALGARVVGRSVSGLAWLGIVVSLAAVVLLTGADVTVSGRALTGDLLAAAAGMLGAAYTTAGEVARRTVSTGLYTSFCYGVCALVLLASAAGAGVQLGGYDRETWLRLIALTATAQLLGHTLFNRVVGRVGATVVSITLLIEVPGAALIAAVFLGQHPPATALPAAALLLVGLVIVVRAEGRRVAPAPMPD